MAYLSGRRLKGKCRIRVSIAGRPGTFVAMQKGVQHFAA
jgi:hypothetical protein